MRRLTVLAALFVVACGGPSAATPPTTTPSAGPPPPTPAPAVAPAVVFLVRHAEKADDGTRNPPLSEPGTARADCLAHTLGDVGVTHLFATELTRTQATVAPLAAKAGVEVTVVPASDTDALIAQLDGLAPASVAVVSGHSNTIPAIAERLGTPLTGLDGQGNYPHEAYDRLVAVVRGPGTPATRLQMRFCAQSAPAS